MWKRNEQKLSFLGLYMILEGIGECQWRGTETKPSGRGNLATGFVECSSVEKYLNYSATFIEEETGEYWRKLYKIQLYLVSFFTVIEPGSYSYHFMHKLPSDLPASIMENYGGIQYRARIIFYSAEEEDIKFKCDFTVLPLIDLNLMPQLNVPWQQDVS